MVMEKIFKCVGNEGDAIPKEVLDKLKLSTYDVNKFGDNMVTVSKALREYNKEIYCTVPFCHTVEPEAFGSSIIFNNIVGNRIGKYAIDDINSASSITNIDLKEGRIAEVLSAIKKLKDQEEKVRLDVTGPISIATSIMDTQVFYKAIRKEKKIIDNLLKIIEDSIVAYIVEGVNQGADIISFADPTGTIDIVGPNLYKEISGKSTYNILNRIENKLNRSICHICGKTSTSLEYIGLLEVEKIKVKGTNYYEMIENLKNERDDIKFIGHWCLKLKQYNKEIVHCKIK